MVIPPPWCHLAWCQLQRQAEHDPSGAMATAALAIVVALVLLGVAYLLLGDRR